MFIREQMISSLYDLHPRFYDDGLLDVYINSPKTCRWQNWTFKPGYYTSPKLTAKQHSNLLNIQRNIKMLSKYPFSQDLAQELQRGVDVYMAFCHGNAAYQDLPVAVRELIDDMPSWGTYGT